MDMPSSRGATGQIQLADEPDFMVGALIAKPSVRQIVAKGCSETVEPKVMQLLVALARARGEVVSRDALVMSCWGGRAVSEDAINRAIAKLRHRGEAEGSFHIETIKRVGLRLVETWPGAMAEFSDQASPTVPTGHKTNRRLFLAAGAATAAAALAGLTIWSRRDADSPPAEVVPLMQQAEIALNQETREGQNQAIGLYRRVVAIAPRYADGWGALGNAYAVTARCRPIDEGDAMRARAIAAGRRALALDPDNGFGEVALATAMPLRGNWLGMERALRRAIAQHGDSQQLLYALALVLCSVGRDVEALALVEQTERLSPPQPHVYFCHSLLLWAVNRIDEADRVLAEAASIYPTHFAIWFNRFYLLLYSGRAGAAIALAQDRDNLPSGIPQAEFDHVLRTAQAIQTRAPAAISSVLADNLALAHQGAGYVENGIAFACAVGRIDHAFALAEAYYFGRGFVVPDLRWTREQGTYSPQRDRLTAFLFLAATRAMRIDPRFEGLMNELGLTHYWQEARMSPDYRSRAAG